MTKLTLKAALLFAAACTTAVPAFAQSATDGAIGGTVQDASGAVIPKATIVIHNNSTNAETTIASDDSGFFRVIHLMPGLYTVTATSPSFQTYKASTVEVTVGALTGVNPHMVSGAENVTVDVTSEAPPINTTSPEFGGLIDQSTLQDAPVSNYRWSAFAALTPGVVVDASGFGLLSIRGQSTLLNNVTIDGADDNQAYFSEERGRTRAGYSTAKSSIQEFQVNISNYSSEFGRAAGGVINSVTKSGGNQFHGDLYFFDRDAEWGGFNNYAVQTVQTAPGVFTSTHIKPTDKRKQYGGAISGPLWKDKVFFFFAGDRFDHNFPAAAVASVPANLFTVPDATLPGTAVCGGTGANAPSTIDATACTLQSNLGLATYSAAASFYTNGIAGLNTMLGVVPRKGLQDIFFPKLDWQINAKNHLALEVNRLRWVSPAGIQTSLTVNNGSASFGNDYVRDTFGIGKLNTLITNSISNEIRYQYGRDFEFEFGQTPTPYEQSNLMTPPSGYVNPMVAPPSVSITNIFTFGTPNFLERAALPDERRWQIADTANYNHGKHNIKFGVDYVHTNDLVNNLFSGFGVYSYSNLLNYFTDLGLSQRPTATTASAYKYTSFVQGFGIPGLEFQTGDYAFFLEDNWKATRRLSITAGLRYEYEQTPTPFTNLVNPALPQTGNHPQNKTNVGPRIGFAYDVFGTGKTVVRGGYGMFFARILNGTIYNSLINTGLQTATGQPAGQSTVSLQPNSVGAPAFPRVIAAAGTLPPLNVVFFDANFKAPQIHQADLTVEQDLGHTTTFGITWLGSYGRRLANFTDINLPTPTTQNYTIVDPSGKGPYAAGSVLTSRFYAKLPNTVASPCVSQRPNCAYGSITDVYSGVTSNYEALVAQLNHRFSNHYSVQANYTWSHALDYGVNNQTASTANNLLDFQNPKADYGNAIENIPNRFVISGVATAPWNFHEAALKYLLNDFEIAPNYQIQSGLPYSMTTSGSLATGFGGVNGSNGTFRVPGTQRNGFRQPKTNTLDLRISKRFALTERVKLELLGESFNIINHQNVTGVNTLGYTVGAAGTLTFNTQTANPTISQFGATTATNSSNFAAAPRQIQVAARLHF